MEEIVKKLQKNPIFKMSLGSKELFHSNFLEYLWDINPNTFIEIINELFPNKQLISNPNSNYQVGRELNNFDFCIYHNDGNKTVYDLVLENKVKSIPYKKQLMDYIDKASKSPDCRFILLALSESFPDKDDNNTSIWPINTDKGNNAEWSVIHYNRLNEMIKKHYLDKKCCEENDSKYIKDYCGFIEQLVRLKDEILPINIYEQKIFEDDTINTLKDIRLHDLYIKLRCSWFALALKEKLIKEKGIESQEIHIINKYDDRKHGINLNVTINQGNGQIAAWICDGLGDEKNKGNTFEVVIQGGQYRHGINQNSVGISGEDKYEILNSCYTRLSEFKDAMDFLNFEDSGDVNPIKKDKFRKTKKDEKTPDKEGPFCCYGEYYIYRYKNIKSEETIGELLDMMVGDVLKLFPNIPKLD